MTKVKIKLDAALRRVWETALKSKTEVANWPAWKRGEYEVTEVTDTLRLAEILSERYRQESLKAAGRFTHTCADALTNLERFVILTREFGEVARAVAVTCDRRPELTSLTTADLRTELIQVAAVSLAWVEGLDKETEGDSTIPRKM